MNAVSRTLVTGLLFAAPMFCLPAFSAGPDDMFQIRSTSKTPDAVAEEIKGYAEKKKWQFLGAQKVKMGEITLVKVCIPEIGKQLWSLGPQISAMLPCGNIGIYLKDGKTEISMLHARYMQAIYPNPTVEKVSAELQPMLMEMLDAVTK